MHLRKNSKQEHLIKNQKHGLNTKARQEEKMYCIEDKK